MKKIANIVYKGKKNNFNQIFNVVGSKDDCINGLPTLFIGLELAKENINGFNILKKKYGDIWWTFTKTERRCDYEVDIIEFYKYAILDKMERVRYTYIDLINFKLDSIKKIIKFLKGDDKKTIFLTRESRFMFIYCEKYNTVFGLSLTLCDYIGVKSSKIFAMCRNVEYVRSSTFMDNEIRAIVGTNTHYILPLYEYFR